MVVRDWEQPGSFGGGSSDSAAAPNAKNWQAVLKYARGQKVRWWLFGGTEPINIFIRTKVMPAAAKLGVEIDLVPVSDTADAVQRVVAERRAGKSSDGGVDMIWINGENFVAGKKAKLWLKGWARSLPNARYVSLVLG